MLIDLTIERNSSRYAGLGPAQDRLIPDGSWNQGSGVGLQIRRDLATHARGVPTTHRSGDLRHAIRILAGKSQQSKGLRAKLVARNQMHVMVGRNYCQNELRKAKKAHYCPRQSSHRRSSAHQCVHRLESRNGLGVAGFPGMDRTDSPDIQE